MCIMFSELIIIAYNCLTFSFVYSLGCAPVYFYSEYMCGAIYTDAIVYASVHSFLPYTGNTCW